MSTQSTLDRSMITEHKVMAWIRSAITDTSNLAADVEHLAIGFTAAFNSAVLPEWAWSEFCIPAGQRLNELELLRCYFTTPTASQAAIWKATESDHRNRSRFPRSAPFGDLIIYLSPPTSTATTTTTATPTPTTSKPTPANPNTPYVNIPATPRTSTPTTPAQPRSKNRVDGCRSPRMVQQRARQIGIR